MQLRNGGGSSPLLRWVLLLASLLLQQLAASAAGSQAFQEEIQGLLDFKLSVSADPQSRLADWEASKSDAPCRWNGVQCNHERHVAALTITDAAISASLPAAAAALAALRNIQRINLRDNNITGAIPAELASLPGLHRIILQGNRISGEIPLELSRLPSLETLDLSRNLLTGGVPADLARLSRLQQLDLSGNRLTGSVPAGLARILSLRLLNLSGNLLTGPIPAELARAHPASAFRGNPGLCGAPLTTTCPPPPAPAQQPAPARHGTAPPGPGQHRMAPPGPDHRQRTAPPGSARPAPPAGAPRRADSGLGFKEIMAIAVGDAVGIVLMGLIFIYCCRRRKLCDYLEQRRRRKTTRAVANSGNLSPLPLSPRPLHYYDSDEEGQEESCRCCCCLRSGREESSGELVVFEDGSSKSKNNSSSNSNGGDDIGSKLSKFNLEDLLRASAYVVGKSGSSIVYKAVLESGATVAVRRLGAAKKRKEFEADVQTLGRIRHPCIVRLRAYYCGSDERLLVYDYIPNGSLATALHGQAAPYSLTSLTWTERLRIAKRVAEGLCYIHEFGNKKLIHGDLRPSNILLSSSMDAYIADLGLRKLIAMSITSSSAAPSRSGSKNATSSASFAHTHHQQAAAPSLSLNLSSAQPIQADDRRRGEMAAYRPPEYAAPGARPTQKWDVYAFGVVLLELLTGKAAAAAGAAAEATAGAATGGEDPRGARGAMAREGLVEWAGKRWAGKRPVYELLDATVAQGPTVPPAADVAEYMRVALACGSAAAEQRPRMKQVVEWLRKIGPGSSSSSSSSNNSS